ncbi:hypothetical protein Srubr_19340 [Streptomyces rubradiris]|uniref:Uncharacterized protein n=1 Tax=Streptomyces rubradiris TaxID=285531 RepID=A0ABQ3R8A3_STRRR|nr:hypothetical protein GCM10018792_59080 [Streptomyces rubradiris]GHI52088.1 hypothetical protein Srubr_19340 [Streptomyces rubradiris]
MPPPPANLILKRSVSQAGTSRTRLSEHIMPAEPSRRAWRGALREPDQRDAREGAGARRVDIAAAGDATALAFQQMLAGRWATAAEHTTRDPGQPGVRLRCYLDLRQELPDPG